MIVIIVYIAVFVAIFIALLIIMLRLKPTKKADKKNITVKPEDINISQSVDDTTDKDNLE